MTPASTGAVHGVNGRGSVVAKTATIRSVPSIEGSESSPECKNSDFSGSANSAASGMSKMVAAPHDATPSRTNVKPEPNTETPTRWAGHSPRVIEPSPRDNSVLSDGAEVANGQWDSTIGKAGLGKTGRVINKLVSDNDALKRDIQIERLKADEAKQAAKLIEDKMERLIDDYESRLLEANVTKTLLARKERQVETLTSHIEMEKKKASLAQERERTWKAEVDKIRAESAERVDEATTHAQLMEGRYNAISSHWREQGDSVKRAMARLRGEIGQVVEARRKDDEKMQLLRDMCDQQDGNIKELRREKEEIARLFELYKQTQEDDLRNIKTEGRRREQEQARMLGEAKDTLDKLKWALNVKKKLDWTE